MDHAEGRTPRLCAVVDDPQLVVSSDSPIATPLVHKLRSYFLSGGNRNMYSQLALTKAQNMVIDVREQKLLFFFLVGGKLFSILERLLS